MEISAESEVESNSMLKWCVIPCLVPPWNSSNPKASHSPLHHDSRDSWNLVPHSNSSSTDPNISVYSIFSLLVPVWHHIPVFFIPVLIALLCSCSHFQYPQLMLCPLTQYIGLLPCMLFDMFKYRLWLLFLTSGHFWHPSELLNSYLWTIGNTLALL